MVDGIEAHQLTKAEGVYGGDLSEMRDPIVK